MEIDILALVVKNKYLGIQNYGWENNFLFRMNLITMSTEETWVQMFMLHASWIVKITI